ncbi:bifunctional helix-turn-helix transcriptional regulator/GNAT family N-acetyltransferase [Acinetobacter oleivorans]|uniref:bifunctional helix-turn-helix transcriptional regulator/GNAT family N-acetyltransferase n=1 Tax=Acinetobacter oleivorans TaxID=1148157 RepID=UPI001901F65E|nr:bifunctional helix-turn-helix transcriptional regulator/GNAT family N-acetyltransferase [Acinetobacter oleivorans]MBJ9740058.1 bifunctional helix-turn-helix transcriptional regulator/GNAT family N-acetyltransferase [Acinetobacter oleivorans]
MIDQKIIDEIRSSSRIMVRELGFMSSTLATTDYSPSAVHSLLELENRGSLTAVQLGQLLGLEKSSVSRMLLKLIKAGEIKEEQDKNDARLKVIKLTPKGVDTVRKINNYGERRVIQAIEKLNSSEQLIIAQGLTAYAESLVDCRDNKDLIDNNTIEIVSGYRAGMIGRIAEMHGTYYYENYNFGSFFEGKVATNLAEFSNRLYKDSNNIWLAIKNNKIVGSVAIDGEDLGNNEAHLRWFILSDDCRGQGIGKKLLKEAINFCDQKQFSAVQLWTFSGLSAARKLYETFGFKLTNEWEGNQWGNTMLEQQFTRVNNGN